MRPDTKLFAAELWSRRHGLTLAEDGEAAQAGVFACTSQSCRAAYDDSPRLSMWWTVRKPAADALDALCRSSDVLALKAEVDPPTACANVLVLSPAHFAAGGSAEIHADGTIVWAQPMRGDRPWTRLTAPSATGSGG